MKFFLYCALPLTFCMPLASADSADQSRELTTVSLIPVGTPSLVKWVKEGRSQKATQMNPGAQPPKNVYLVSGPKQDGKKEEALNFSLNIPTKRIPLQSQNWKLIQRVATEKDKTQSKVYIEGSLPELKGDYSIFLSRKVGHKNWKNPSYRILSDDVKRFPLGAVRILNISPFKILVTVDDANVGILAPGKSLVAKKLQGRQLKLWAIKKNKEKVLFFRRNMEQKSNARTNLACTLAHTRSNPVTVHWVLAPPPYKEEEPKKKSVESSQTETTQQDSDE